MIMMNWYTKSDMNASIMHMITKLGNQSDCPWLTKTVFIVSPKAISISPTSSTSSVVGDTKEEEDELSLVSIVNCGCIHHILHGRTEYE